MLKRLAILIFAFKLTLMTGCDFPDPPPSCHKCHHERHKKGDCKHTTMGRFYDTIPCWCPEGTP